MPFDVELTGKGPGRKHDTTVATSHSADLEYQARSPDLMSSPTHRLGHHRSSLINMRASFGWAGSPNTPEADSSAQSDEV